MAKKEQEQPLVEEAPQPLPRWETTLKMLTLSGVEVGMKVAQIDRACGELGLKHEGQDGPPAMAKLGSIEEANYAGLNDELVAIDEKSGTLVLSRTGGLRPFARSRPVEEKT